MGSICQLKFYCHSKEIADRISQDAINEALRLESKYSRYLDNSITSQINRSSGNKNGVIVDEETTALLNYADTAYQQSNELFDITSGVLRKAWDFTSNNIPTKNNILTYLKLVGWHNIIWQAPKLILPYAGTEIDFGGYVKEYATDVLARIFLDSKLEFGLVSMGGDINVFGPHPDGKPWQIGIQDPRSEVKKAIAYINITKAALASSGDYERFMIVDEQRYCHIINPKTGWPIQNSFASVSVVAEQCLIAGTSATIAMLMEHNGKAWLENTGLDYLGINASNAITGTLSVN